MLPASWRFFEVRLSQAALCKDDVNVCLVSPWFSLLVRRASISLILIQLQQTAGTQCLLDENTTEFILALASRLEVAQDPYGYQRE